MIKKTYQYGIKHRKPYPLREDDYRTSDMMFTEQGFYKRRIRSFYFGKYHLSTVFLVIDHRFSDEGPPVLFETMLFKDGDDIECYRSCTHREAILTHLAVKRAHFGRKKPIKQAKYHHRKLQ